MHRLFRFIVYLFAIIGFTLVSGYFALRFGLTNTPGVIDSQRDYFQKGILSNTPTWSQTIEWQTLKAVISKESDSIAQAAYKAGVSPRMLAAPLVVEQLRLYHSDRELFKKVFAPLQILGNQSQFSWGVMGIKRDTAEQIEAHLLNSTSPYYPGKAYENLLRFSTSDPDTERFERLTSPTDRSYSYLYAALMLKEFIVQWEKSGIDISAKPDILATLFNIGFENSHPNPNPHSGGAVIILDGVEYSFGSLASSFYNSDELLDIFPR